MEKKEKTLFEQLASINVNEKTEKKDGLTYLSWTYAIDEMSRQCPDFDYDVEPYTYDENLGYMVYTHVTVNGVTKRMWLPVMDGKNKAMKNQPYKYMTKHGEKTVEAATMTDINKAYMRCLVKNIGMFGLGLYIYAGEDLPQVDEDEITKEQIKFITNAYKENLYKLLEANKIEKIEEMPKAKATEIIQKIMEKQNATK